MIVEHNLAAKAIHVRVDRSKIISHGKPSLGRMLCRIQVWRCIADVKVLQGVLRTAQRRGWRVRSLEADCGVKARAGVEICAGEYCSEGGRRSGAEGV
jgi:Peptidase family M49